MVKDTKMSLMSSAGAFSGEFEITKSWSGYNDDIDLGSSLLIARNKIITIGRALNNTVRLNHLAISGTHCIIWVVQFDENSVPLVYIKDISLNGTYINDRRLAKKEVVLLHHGDMVSIPFGLEMEFRAAYGSAESDVGQQLIEENYIRTNFSRWTIKDRVLGNGTFGYVFACESKGDSKLYAVKVVKNTSQLVPFEAKVLQKLDHPNIIRVHQTQIIEGQLYIFEDLICGGDLFSYLAKGNSLSSIPEFEVLVVTYQIMNALFYLHKNNIVHRDLKLDNILLESPEPFSRVVLADFGIAKSISSTRRRMFTTVGTPEYCAPEVGFEYTKIPESARTDITSKVSLVKRGYDHKCDIWSLGIIVHIMLSGVSPFYEDGDEVKIIQSAKKGILNFNLKQWRGVSSHAKDFVQSLLYVNIAKRLSIEECFEHQWIKKHESELKKIYERVTH